jgi:hypothetical protein
MSPMALIFKALGCSFKDQGDFFMAGEVSQVA